MLSGVCKSQSLDQSIYYQKENASISKILSDLEEQYGLRFSYSSSDWASKKMNVSFEGENVIEVLDYLLNNDEIDYKIVADNILLRKNHQNQSAISENYKTSLHIKGKVVTSSDENEKLPFAVIAIPDTHIGTYANDEGSFDLEIPAEFIDQKLMVSYIGYKKVFYNIQELESEYLLIPLSESTNYIEKITILNQEKPIHVGNYYHSLKLNSFHLSGNASSLIAGDLNRTIQMLPGISAFNDDNSAILIRGSNSDQTLTIFDGMPIYNKGHYYGIFSPINGKYIESVNVYKNTYPLEYDGGVSGLVEYKSKQSLEGESNAQLGIDLLTIQGLAQISINDKIGLKIGGRSTLRPITNNQFNTTSTNQNNLQQIQLFGEKIRNKRSDPQFNFYDLNLGMVIQANKRNDIEINGFNSKDEFVNQYKTSVQDKNENKVGLKIDENQDWTNSAGSIIWNHKIRNNLILKTRAYYSEYVNNEDNRITLDKKFKNVNLPPNINNPNGTLLSNRHENKLEDYGLDLNLSYALNRQAFLIGLASKKQSVDYAFIENNQPNIRGSEEFQAFSGYGQYVFNYKDITLSSGIRVSYYDHIERILTSPRFSANYQINDHLTLKSSYGLQQQVIRQFYYEFRGVPKEFWVGANDKQIPVLKSHNYMVGTTWSFNNISVDIEAFQKYQKGLTEYAVLNPDDAENNPEKARDYQLFKGDGMIRGIDFLVANQIKNYNTFLSYTLSWSNERYRPINKNQYFPSENDRRHQIKWVNSFNVKQWNFGLNLTYASGRPYTDIGSIGVIADIREVDPSKWLNRLPDYKRVDINAGYLFSIGNTKVEATASIFNLLNNQNVKYVQSVITELSANQNPVNTVLGNDSALLNRTFNFGLTIKL